MSSSRDKRGRKTANRQAPPERSSSEKRKPSGSPLDSIPSKSSKPLVQSTLQLDMQDVFSFGTCSTPQANYTDPKDKMADNPQQQGGSTQPAGGSSPHEVSYPTTLFNFINEASVDVLTTKLSNALMLPALQEKFRESFVAVARDAISEIIQDFVAPLKKEIKDLREQLDDKTDELEQYSRRNSIRITGVKESTDDGKEDIDDTVLNLLKEVHPDVSATDIDRCHRIGKKYPGKSRSIIVKFVSYWDRSKVITNRRKLKSSRKHVYINEDLTQHRSHLFKLARDLRTQGRIYSTWTRDGRIYISDQPEGMIRVIHRESDLDRYSHN